MQAGIRDFSSAHEQPYIAYWGGEWTKEDLRRVQVDAGDPAGQGRLEAYTLLHSVYLWRKIIKNAQGSLAVMGDALGVLHDAMKFRAKIQH